MVDIITKHMYYSLKERFVTNHFTSYFFILSPFTLASPQLQKKSYKKNYIKYNLIS